MARINEQGVQPGGRKRASARARGNAGAASGAIREFMRAEVHRVDGEASANDAARLMWEKDIGSVPIVDEDGKLIGIVTDRDIAMASYLRGVTLWNIPVRSLITRELIVARADDAISDVSALMSQRQVRRVPIVDDQGVLVGIVSLNDLALAATGAEPNGAITEHEVADALRAICAPRSSAAGQQLRAD
jgi:CBS domain-containing protein